MKKTQVGDQMMKFNYRTIKQLAKQTEGASVRDLIALAPQNDPFYVGTRGDEEKGRWFAELWHRFGYTRGVHLRRVHYQVVSQAPPVLKPDGTPYQNTEKDWDYLNQASKCARYLGLVDPDAFVDRRNPEPHVCVHYWDNPTPRYELRDDWGGLDVALPSFPDLPDFTVSGYDDGNLQPFHLEIWCEKTTANDVLLPVCHQYGVNLITGAGEMSITSVLKALRRIEDAGRRACLLYISDFDPAGYGMPVSVSRKIEFLLADRRLDMDIQLEPIALTKEQVLAYNLPRMPIKASELRRRSFVEAHGQGAVELDALEGLYPGLLRQIVEDAVLRYHDPEVVRRAQEQRRVLSRALEQAQAEALAPFVDEIEALEEVFRHAASAFDDAVAEVRARLGELYPQIVAALEEIDVNPDDYPLPDPREPDEFNEPLYDSRRDYLRQLACYKLYQNGVGR